MIQVSSYSCEPAYKLYLSGSGIIHTIDIRQVIRIQSISNYSKLFFSNGNTLVVAKVLRWFEERLHLVEFIRVHRTHLVNARYIDYYQNSVLGRKLMLKNGEIIDVSKRKEADFLKTLRSSQQSRSIEIIIKKSVA